jgi:hypothetical protein
VFGRVDEKPKASDAGYDGGNTFKDEDLRVSVSKLSRLFSRRLTHRQPSYPPTPSIFEIANASKPENAPAIALAVKNIAIRV